MLGIKIRRENVIRSTFSEIMEKSKLYVMKIIERRNESIN